MRSPGKFMTYCIRTGIFLLAVYGQSSFGQVYFSVNPNYLKVKHESANLLTDYKPDFPDTTIYELHNYFPRNNLGNTGLPSPSYFLHYGTPALGFRLYDAPFRIDRFYEKDVPYYRSAGPFASLTGIAGARELQAFKALFTHTYKNRVNVAVAFRRYTSKVFTGDNKPTPTI